MKLEATDPSERMHLSTKSDGVTSYKTVMLAVIEIWGPWKMGIFDQLSDYQYWVCHRAAVFKLEWTVVVSPKTAHEDLIWLSLKTITWG